MLKPRVIPCLLLKNTGLVKTVNFKNPQYVGDPVNAVKIFNDKEVDELILFDTTATVEKKKPNLSLLRDIASECFMPLTYGGGIRSLQDMREIFKLGVEKICVNTQAILSPSLVRQASEVFGSQSIVVCLDVRRNSSGRHEVYTHGGTKKANEDAVALAQEMQSMGAGEMVLNSMDRDGTQKGYDMELIRSVSTRVSIPVIACGGAGTLDDFARAVACGAAAVAAGSMFVFHGKRRAVLISYPEILELQSIFGFSSMEKL